MSSGERKVRSVGARIAVRTCLTFGVLFVLAGALVLGMTIRHHVREYHDVLNRLVSDLVGEFANCGGDAEKMREYMEEDAEELGARNVFSLIMAPEGRPLVEYSSHQGLLQEMRRRSPELALSHHTLRLVTAWEDGRKLVVRVCRAELANGNVLMEGWNVTGDEDLIIRLAVLFAAALLVFMMVGVFIGMDLGRRFACPLRQIVDAAARMAGRDYTVRVPITQEGREIRELEQAFNAMCEANEKTLNELKLLTDDIAHDLRTPLTRLRAAAELVATEGELEHPLSETVAEETEAMLEMINTMLDISRSEHRIDSTPREEIDLVDFTRRFIDLYTAVAEDRGLSLTWELPEGRLPYSGHRGKLQRLLGNLLDNAMKFTPPGGKVSVTLHTASGEAAVGLRSASVVLEVKNTGPGIAAEDIPCVFRRFWRADSSRSLPGNGLGLALVKAIVTAAGGTVTCRSTPGEKTTFTVTLARM